MKKRVLSIVCVIALIATMISAGAIYAIGTNTAPLGNETAFSFDGSTFVSTDWTATNNSPAFDGTGLKLSSVNDTTYATVKYANEYNLTNGFTLEYSAKAVAQNSVIDAGTYFTGVQIGNITVAMDQFIKPVILVDGAVKATGTAISTATTGTDIRDWVTNTEPDIGEIKYTVTYNATAKTLTYARTHGSTEVFSVVYTDATNLIDVTSAEVALYHNNNKRSRATYKSISLKGAATGATPPAPLAPSVFCTGLECTASKPAVKADWTFDPTGSSAVDASTGGITLDSGANNKDLQKATYNDTFILTEGFTLTYTAKTSGTKNVGNNPGKYVGATVGNITAYLTSVSTKDAVVMKIAIDGTDVATSDVIYDQNHPVWGSAIGTDTASQVEYFFGYFLHNSKFTLNYDPATKAITYSLSVNGDEQGVLTYTDANGTVDVADAVLELVSGRAYNAKTYYTDIKLVGASFPGHEYDDDNDTTCNTCGEVRTVGGGENPGGENPGGENPGGENPGGNEPASEKGEALTSAWAPESFVAADWSNTDKLTSDGKFVIESGNGTKTIWTTKNYDLSTGFKFKGTLTMKNDYNNYFGEWCSAYFGDEGKNLELRIKNDSPDNNVKDDTYTAYLYYNGTELASFDLDKAPNGEYEVTYKDGKVSVSLGGVAIFTDVAITADLSNAKLGLRLTGNYKANGREWKYISLAPLSADGTGTGTGDGTGTGGAVVKGETLTETWAPEKLAAADWTGDTNNITAGSGKFRTNGNRNTYTIWTAKKYDFSKGVGFKGTLVMKNGYNNFYEEYCSMYLGSEQQNIELRVQNKGADVTTTVNEDGDEETTSTNKGYELHVVCNGIVLATYDLEMEPNNVYELLYKDGRVQVKMNEEIVKFVLADGTKVRSLPVDIDLSNAKAGLMLTGNSGPTNGRVWSDVVLTPLAADVDLDAVIKGETLDLFAPEKFLVEDWEDSEDMFTDEGEFTIVTGNGKKTIWTAKSYDLSGGFKFKGTLAMKNAYNNFYGEWCSVYFGNENDNLELRIKNDSTSNAAEEKDNTYTAYIYYANVELASADLLTLPNGEYEVTYKDGKVNVSLGGISITWTLTDGSESTVVTIPEPELYNAKLGLRLTGNYGPRNSRSWSAISLASLSSKGAAVTGDARSLVLPACVMLVSAVAVAFVLIRKKTRA